MTGIASPRSWRIRLVYPLIVAFALATGVFYQALLTAPLVTHTYAAFFDFENVRPKTLQQAWRPRVLSRLGAARFGQYHSALPAPPTARGQPVPEWQSIAIGQWQACWFLAICAIVIVAWPDWALFFVLATYACVTFGYVSGPDIRIYPWDLPALCVFTLVTALMHRRVQPWIIMLVVWLGVPFKETAIVLSAFAMALPLSSRKRLFYTVATFAGCAAIKLFVDLATGNTAIGVTMAHQSFYDTGPLLWWNLRQLATGYPLAINGGLFLIFWLLPGSDPMLRALRMMAALFTAGNLAFGVITEYRIWFEMIPWSLYGLALCVTGRSTTDRGDPTKATAIASV